MPSEAFLPSRQELAQTFTISPLDNAGKVYLVYCFCISYGDWPYYLVATTPTLPTNSVEYIYKVHLFSVMNNHIFFLMKKPLTAVCDYLLHIHPCSV